MRFHLHRFHCNNNNNNNNNLCNNLLLLLFLALPVSDFFPLPRLGDPDLSLVFLSLSLGDLLLDDPGLEPFLPEPIN